MDEREHMFYNSITRLVKPNAEEWKAFYSAFEFKTIKKNKEYLKAGQVAGRMACVLKGCFRMYYILDGEERCKDFQSEGQFTGSLYSLLSGEPALFTVAAIEDSDVLEIKAGDLFALFDSYKVWERFGRLYIQQAFLYKEKREAALLTELAAERYLNLKKQHPDWVQRIPQKYLASYLGIKAESLSRIRRMK